LTDNYQILIKKLDTFIRKYYKNQLIKGGIYFISIFVLFFLVFNIAEYFGHFNVSVRTALFYAYLLLNLLILYRFIIVPVLKLFQIGKVISHEQAAWIIGKHFPNVSDRLINTLQLKQLAESKGNINLELINAGIDQRIADLKPVAFTKAVDFSKNKRYLKFAAPPLLFLLIILVSAPRVITEPANRLVNHNDFYEKDFGFSLSVVNDKLEGVQHEDFNLEVKASGDEIPENVYLETENNKIKLVRENAIRFHHNFINLQKNIKFRIVSDRYKTDYYELKVMPKPVVLDFEVSLDYPKYIGKANEILSNIGDLIIPVGTKVTWKFFTKNTDEITFRFNNIPTIIDKNNSNTFSYGKKFYKNNNYSVKISNSFLTSQDSLSYTVNIIPDLYPTILIEEYRDSLNNENLYFKGIIKDDYGFKKLTFNFVKKNPEGGKGRVKSKILDFSLKTNPQQFFHYFDLASVDLNPGDEIEYYFEIWDNDGINGSKSSRSQIMSYKLATLDEMKKQTDQSNKDIKDEMKEALDEVKQLKKEIDEINKKLIDKKELNWEDKQQIKSLLEKQQNIQKKVENIKKENERKLQQEQQYKEINEDLLEKQKQLDELMEKVMENDEIKKLMEELQKLLDEVDKDKVNEMLEKMKMSEKEMEQMLDRNLELFKKFEFEQKLEDTKNKMGELAKKQEELSKQSEHKEKESEELKKDQEKINEEFDKLSEELEKLDSLNKDMENPEDFDKMEEEQESVKQDQKESTESLEKNQRKKASKSQKSASQKMQEMADAMAQMQESSAQEGMAEDIDALREILENLIQLSFNEEDLLKEVKTINLSDPRYNGLIQRQNNIKDDLKMVEDSLFALSKRQMMIKPFINKEISIINDNIDRSIAYMNDRRTDIAAGKQQYAMTSMNNLALLLSETLNQMMQSMMKSSSSSSKGQPKNSCPNPGSGKPSMSSLQQQLNKQIEQMKKGMEKGKKKGGKKPGEKKGKGQGGSQGMSEKLARMAAQQEALRNQLGQYADELEKQGQYGSSKELKKAMEQMEKTETDLVNKMLTGETLKRQQDILTRLLKSEKAELEREKEKKRKSTEAKNQNYRNPDEFFQYKKSKSNEVELLRTIPPSLKPFYKNKVNAYFFNFEELLDK